VQIYEKFLINHFTFLIFIRTSDCIEGTFARKYLNKFGILLTYSSSDFVEGTFVRKYPNKFGILLTYSYLCSRITKNNNKKWTTTRRIITIRKAGDKVAKLLIPLLLKTIVVLQKGLAQ